MNKSTVKKREGFNVIKLKPLDDTVMLEEDLEKGETSILKRISTSTDTSTKFLSKEKINECIEDTIAMKIKQKEENTVSYEDKLKERVKDVDVIIEKKANAKVDKMSQTSSLRLKLFNKLKGK